MNLEFAIIGIIASPIVFFGIVLLVAYLYKIKRKDLEFKIIFNFMMFAAFSIDVAMFGIILIDTLPFVAIIIYLCSGPYFLYIIPNTVKTIRIFKNKTESQSELLSNLVKASSEISVNVSNNATELAASASEVNASSEEIAATTMEITLKVKNQADSLIKINKEMQNIKEIADIIKNISEQTNLLALNASIEAGRAGEHGRGFAVVAERVQKLAEEARNSVEKTADIVEKISNDIEISTSDSLDISNAMEEISTAAEEQTASMEEISATAEKLGEDAKNLKEQLSQKELNKANYKMNAHQILRL